MAISREIIPLAALYPPLNYFFLGGGCCYGSNFTGYYRVSYNELMVPINLYVRLEGLAASIRVLVPMMYDEP